MAHDQLSKKRIKCDVSIEDSVSSETDSELDEELDLMFTGTLSFSSEDDNETSPRKNNKAYLDVNYARKLPKSLSCDDLGQFQTEKTSFEIISAKTVKDKHSKYVLYTVAVLRTIGNDTSQALIERRYSEFHRFYLEIKRQFPEPMHRLVFPPKAVTGNFRHQMIAQRSRAFEQFLTHIFSLPDVRTCPDFEDFFYNRDLRVARGYLLEGDFLEAVPLLQNALHLQEKLLGPTHPKIITTLCAVTVAYASNESDQHAKDYADAALRCCHSADPLLIPLLHSAIGIYWRLGLAKRQLETRLDACVKGGLTVDHMASLREQVLQQLSVDLDRD